MITLAKYEELVSLILTNGFQSQPVEVLTEIRKKATILYSDGKETTLSDTEFDGIDEYIKAYEKDDVSPIVTSKLSHSKKVKLPFPMGSLNQIFQGDYYKWLIKHNLKQEEITITEKLDGVSNMLIYGSDGRLKMSYSRGDGIEGQNVIRHAIEMDVIPKTLATNSLGAVRGEIILSYEKFLRLRELVKTRGGKQYKNPRNMIAGLMNAGVNDNIVYPSMDFIAYEIVGSKLGKREQLLELKVNGFKTVYHKTFIGNELTDERLTEELRLIKDNNLYEIDGIVIDVNDPQRRLEINPSTETLNPEYSVKYKVADETNYAEPEVLDIELNLSKDGYIIPVLIIEPTDLCGVTISRTSGFNMGFIYANKIQPGCKIKLTRAGDVTPFCRGLAEPGALI